MRVVWLSAESVCHRRVCSEPAESDDPPSAGSPSGSFLNKITQSIGSFTLDCKTFFFRFVAPLNGHKTDPAKQQSCRLFSGCWVSLFGSLGIFSLVWPGWTSWGLCNQIQKVKSVQGGKCMLGSKMHEGLGTVVRKLSFLFNWLDFLLDFTAPVVSHWSQFLSIYVLSSNPPHGERSERNQRYSKNPSESYLSPRSRLAVPRVQDQEFKGSSEFMGRLAGGAAGSVFWGKSWAWAEVIRRRSWQCRGCRRWPGCCAGCRVWGRARGGGSRQACWRAAWGCWWWRRWNLVPRSSASGHPSERSDWNDWGDKHTNTLFNF